MRTILGFLVAVTLGLTAPASAQTDFPNRAVTIIVPFAAGGPSDVVTRILADELKTVWNQPVVVDNKPGGGTVVGNAAGARAKPDGYTLLMVSPAFTILHGVRSSLPYDTLNDFTGVSVFVDAPLAIVSHLGFAPNTLPEFIAEARKRTDKPLTYASSGVATSPHMGAELMQRKLNIKLVHVPYQGAAPALADTLSGRVDVQMGTWADLRPHVESGKLKLISVMYRNRLPEAPNVATADETNKELGLPQGAFNAILAPAGTPKEIVAKIAAGIQTVVASKTFKDRILAIGSYPYFTTPEATDAFIKREVLNWAEIAKAAGIRVD